MSEWQQMTLGELLDVSDGSIKTGPFGTTLKASEYSLHGVPIISVGEVGYGRLKVHEGTPRAGTDITSRLSDYVLRAGDIVFGRKGAVDRSALVLPEQDGWFLGSDGLRVRVHSGVDPRFLAYQLQEVRIRKWLLQHASGSTLLSLNHQTLSAVPLNVPGAAVQRAVADVLSALDDKIAANNELAATADELVQAEFTAALKGVGPAELTFADVAKVGGGGTPRSKVPEFWGGDVPWLTPTDVTALAGPYVRRTKRTITESGLHSISSPLYPAGSIFMTSRATIGAFAIAGRPMTVNQGFIVVEARDENERYWLFHEMRSRVPEFLEHANGATFLELSRGNFKKLPVRWPEPRAIRSFGARARVLHDRASAALQESDGLVEIRDALLPMLMSGRLTVRDAEVVVESVVDRGAVESEALASGTLW